ncbi:hypothetical protein [Streptomyces erythrochromogenes]|uniref:hypothetical protein n=1 Tax=Streptomyces erythrochromogenes TaxID=285574 RepID=UPI0037D44A0C
MVTYTEDWGYETPVVKEWYYLGTDQGDAREAWEEMVFELQFNDPDDALKAEIMTIEPLIEWQVRQ